MANENKERTINTVTKGFDDGYVMLPLATYNNLLAESLISCMTIDTAAWNNTVEVSVDKEKVYNAALSLLSRSVGVDPGAYNVVELKDFGYGLAGLKIATPRAEEVTDDAE